MATLRTRRVADLLMKEVATIIQREIKDPRMGFITITAADVSPDLHHAKIFYTVFGDEEVKAATQKALHSARSYIRRELGKILTMKTTPQLNFVYDVSIERGMHLEELIEQTSHDDKEEDS